MSGPIRQNQLTGAVWLMLLSPALRLFPSVSAEAAGRWAPLCALLSVLPAGLYLALARRVLKRRLRGEGIGELVRRALPGRGGRMAALLLGLWLCVYAGFILRSGADRLIVAVYPETPPVFFIVTMLLAALFAATAGEGGLVRAAMLLLAASGLTLAVVLLFSLGSVQWDNLLPPPGAAVKPPEAAGLARGVLAALDLLLGGVFVGTLLLSELERGSFSPGRGFLSLSAFALVLGLLSAELIGCFGSALTARLAWPFFSLVRNLVFFRSIERIEALVVALWVFPDFLIVALFLRQGARCVTASLGARWGTLRAFPAALGLCALAALVFALTAAPDGETLQRLSRTLIPAGNLLVMLLFFPAILGAGLRSGRL